MSSETIQEDSAKKRKLSEVEAEAAIFDKPRKKPIACGPCHSRKIKCSFGHPCTHCAQTRNPEACIYPTRDSKITVSSNYVERLVAENRRLRERSQANEVQNSSGHVADGASKVPELAIEASEARNPLHDERSWFFPLANSGPIHISEAADAAFATRLRQTLQPNGVAEHIPRMDYVTDAKLIALAETDVPWPSLARAKLLIKTAFDTVGSCYYCVRKTDIYNGLKRHYRNPLAPRTIFTCKLEALFALGEAYSCRTQSTSEDTFPGLAYFARACRTIRGVRERPQMDWIEVLLLLSMYSLLLNRRHSAYYLASAAVRTSIILGLHQKIPEFQLTDRAAREHRVRVWWTCYTLERLWAGKIGHPVSIQDDEIGADLPSNAGLSEDDLSDFPDEEYANASIRLARLSRNIIHSIYNRRPTQVAFSQRVQAALKELRAWVEGLPKHLQLPASLGLQPLQRPQKWLHLTFNQYVIQTTRPILLHVIRAHRELWLSPGRGTDFKQVIGEPALALSEACIRCARHSHRLLTDTWIDGSFAIFDYTYTQYLFASATILAISSLSIGQNDESDKDGFESACQFIEQLHQNGNYGAKEMVRHLEGIKLSMAAFKGDSSLEALNALSNAATMLQGHGGSIPTPSSTTPGSAFQPTMTAEMALAEPSLQDFLSQAEFDPTFLDAQIQGDQVNGMYYSMLQDESWLAF
ncbi:hypothetical protein LTS08_005025 [Lithohypha guttulata]|nr:hypothetical protein LTS08_005025 [Lithohypha guttulata]